MIEGEWKTKPIKWKVVYTPIIYLTEPNECVNNEPDKL